MLFDAMKIKSSCSRHIEQLYQQLTVMGRCWDDSQCLLTVRYHVGIFLILHKVGCRFQLLCFAVAVLPPRIGRFLLVKTKGKLSIRRMRSFPFSVERNISKPYSSLFLLSQPSSPLQTRADSWRCRCALYRCAAHSRWLLSSGGSTPLQISQSTAALM